MLTTFPEILSEIGSAVWGWPMVVFLLGTHFFLTVRLRFPQRYIFKAIKLSVTRDKDASGDVSQFGALMTALAATIGTGNIVGVATAVSLGGPGAVLWCWLSGVFGIATKYSEGLLSIKYRVRTKSGSTLGGPMFALERGLHCKWLAVLFAVFTAIASFGIGDAVQANSISMVLNESCGIKPIVVAVVLSALVLLVVIFGLKGISRVCSALVPIMAVLYVIGCVIILIINGSYLGETVSLICRSAFSAKAAGGGFVGTSVIMALRFGLSRGLFSNESGLGSAPIVAAAAKTRNPVRQALVSSTGTFWDTVVVCALTGMVIVSSIIANPEIDPSQGAVLTKLAFDNLPVIGPIILSVGMVSFGFSTILGWSYYGEKAVEYLVMRKSESFRRRVILVFRLTWVAVAFLGSIISLSVVWSLSDIANALMAVPNLISLLLLSGVIVSETRKYLWRGHLDDYSDDEEVVVGE